MPKLEPPRPAQKFLLRFLREDLAEEVCGDLDEKFYSTIKNKSTLRARLNYWYQVLQYVRPFAIRKSRLVHTNHYAMYKSYFKIGWRNLIKNKGYSFINIGGLAVGMAVAMLIGLWVYDELDYNKYHQNYAQLVQVMQHQTFNGVKGTENSLPRPLENVLRNEYRSDFKYFSMASWTGDHILSFGEQKISKTGNYMQVDFPEMVDLKMIKGSRRTLNDPTSILLSETTSNALFGNEESINKSIRIDNKFDVKVTGVYEDLPYNTTFRDLKFIASWDLYITSEKWVLNSLDNWGNNSFQLYAQLNTNADPLRVSEKIKEAKARHAKNEREFKPELFLHAMKDWHLRAEWKDGINVGGRIEMVWLFSIIGAFVLLLACINFMNLGTAHSEKRAKEVGIRMAVGSVRSQLINQFLSESFLIVLLSFVVAMGVVIIMLPWFNQLADKKIIIDWSNPFFWLVSICFIIVTSFLAGSYPALYLSSFHPVTVLKGTFKLGKYASIPRKVLVVIQFTVSITLIIGTILVYKQIEFTKNRPVGYDRKGLVMIHMVSSEFYGKYDILRTELKNSGAVEEMSESSSPVTEIWSNDGGFDWPGKNPNLQTDFATIRVTEEYGKTMNWQVKEGRDFSRDFSTDKRGLILNEAAIKFMGIKNPIGMKIKWGDGSLHIIGVVNDMIMQSPYAPVKQAIYVIDYENANWINLRLNPAKSVKESIGQVESVFKKHIPSAPFMYKFVDDEYATKFEADERIGKLASVFSILAILISCLGIFGLASYVAERRTKEIGIRKVLGASLLQLWQMLSKDFIILVIIACMIAIPIAYYFMQGWLKKYEYHTEIPWHVFGVSSLGALAITVATISYQVLKAAMTNPVNSLKSE